MKSSHCPKIWAKRFEKFCPDVEYFGQCDDFIYIFILKNPNLYHITQSCEQMTYLNIKPRQYELHRRSSVRCFWPFTILWKIVNFRSFVVLSYAWTQKLLLKWSRLKYRYVTKYFYRHFRYLFKHCSFRHASTTCTCTAVQITNKTFYCTLEILFV